MKWSHALCVAIGLLFAACFGWIGIGETRPPLFVQMGFPDGDILVLFCFALVALTWYWAIATIGRSQRRNAWIVNWEDDHAE